MNKKINKKILIVTVAALAVLVVGASTALAYGGANAYETLKDLTGMTDEQIAAERQDGIRLGEIAEEKGVYEKFRDAMMEDKFDVLKQRVEDGTLTQEEADEIKKNLENCNGTGEGAYMRGLRGGGNGRGCGNGAQCTTDGTSAPRGGFRGMGRNKG